MDDFVELVTNSLPLCPREFASFLPDETSAIGAARGQVYRQRSPTKLMVTLAFAEHADEVAALDVDGVGLLRAEFMVTDALAGVHPKLLIGRGGRAAFVHALTESIFTVTRAFTGRPVLYRFLDLRSDEFALLEGADRFEVAGESCASGLRGCFRAVREPDVFRLELDAVARVFRESPNLRVAVPFVRSNWELRACLDLIGDSAVEKELPVSILAEVPSVAFRLRDYASMGVTGVAIGLSNLTQLVLGVDRDSIVADELFDETDAAVFDTIARIIAGARQAGIASSLIGVPPNSTQFIQQLMRLGLSSVSVNPGELAATRSALEGVNLDASS